MFVQFLSLIAAAALLASPVWAQDYKLGSLEITSHGRAPRRQRPRPAAAT